MKITDILVCIMGILLVYSLLASLILFIKTLINEKYHIKIHFKNSKKYIGHKEPIYKLTNDEYDCYITKYVLNYEHKMIMDIFTVLFIYPISIYIYGYHEEGEIYFCHEEYLNNKVDKLMEDNISLGEYYENEVILNNISTKKENAFIMDSNNKINKLNEEFDENYI